MTVPGHIHLDPVGGIAGDMFVAAMLDAFPEIRDRVLADLARILPPEAGQPRLSEGRSGAVRALRLRLEPPPSAHRHHHAHGSYREMVERIGAAGLSESTAEHAAAILTHLARAEARIHDVPLDEVHFHEIADWDSLMDVVAAGSIAAALPGAGWSVAPLPRGHGLLRTEHGMLPVPAPATVEILQGFSWRDDGIGGERVTPTGAAILKHLVTQDAKAEGRLLASGTGAGTRELKGMPNILRVLAFETAHQGRERIAALSFDVDDMTGEEIGIAAERLREMPGVRDLAIATLMGKKGRPMQGFRLLVEPQALEAVKTRCLMETSTIGLRWHLEEREVLDRHGAERRDGGRTLRVKYAARPGGATAKVESDDLAGLGSFRERRAAGRRLEEAPE
ncbi:nickel pincer cofactor biosynthesis protein LarC [Roseomonas marmotae]|uniref:LarC family nickel insertion protein n=1 Tax=Roseomonas marmotae TaxID=2768161 RepID=A0ABS3KFM1_9PROT|nr:LarC family nickel insertion protein [Roseomonas marmotae]MBO1076271.1 LarC family nickel insertion protein [Roseomonas marmotae]QTI77848.1 LarC family nickel insertion protein [Roseomonas marmotae]